MFSLEELLSNCFFPLFCSNLTAKYYKKTSKVSRNKSKFRLPRILLNIPRDPMEHSPESLITFPGLFKIPRNLLEHSPCSLLEHFPESSRAFSGIFNLWNIPGNVLPRNVLEHSPEFSSAFLGMVKWEHSPEPSNRFPGILVNIPCVPCIACIPFPIPVFLVLQIAFNVISFYFLEKHYLTIIKPVLCSMWL